MTNLSIRKLEMKKETAGFFIGAIILLISSVLAILFVHKQFAGYDLSPIIDLSWRLANHQTPGVDFINTMPPLFIILVKLISWGNLHWVDLTIINIIASIGTFLFLYIVSDHREESVWWGLFIAIILAMPLVYTNHIWPSTLAQLSGIMFFYAVYVAMNSNRLSAKTLLSIFFASGVLAISKQNVALPMILTVVVFLFFLKRRDRFTLIIFILFGTVSGVVLSMLYLGYSFHSFLYTYYAVLGRAKVDAEMLIFLARFESHYPLALIMLGISVFSLYTIYKKNSGISDVNKIYFLLILAISFIPIYSDCDAKMNNISLPLFILTTGIFSSLQISVDVDTSQRHHYQITLRIVTTFVLLLMIYALSVLFGYLRERMIQTGPFAGIDENIVIDQGYFGGLRTGNLFSGVLKEMALAKKEFPHQKIFFGPRMEFGYLYTKSPSPLGLSLWWHPGTSYSMDDEKKVIEHFIQAKFDVLIFPKVEKFRIPGDILNFIADHYWLNPKYRYIDLYRKTNTNSALAYYDKGNAYAKLGQYKQAIECYNQAIHINPDYAHAHYLRGIVYLEPGQYQKAIQDFSETIRIQPDYISAYYDRGRAYAKTGQYQQAIRDYDETIHLKPDHADAYNNRGAIFLNLGNRERGCLDARKACELGNCKILNIAERSRVCR
jgi:regulator of sirC expression with transglutaminase-like and TPR domain